MADVRALLKAKRQEARVTHPLATYSANGQLRCIACGMAIRQASSWEGHVGSKVHRVNVARMREEEARRAAKEDEARRKRKMSEDAEAGDEEGAEEGVKKKARVAAGEAGAAGRAASRERSGTPAHTRSHAATGFPADFFSDPSRAPPPPPDEEDEQDVGEGAAQQAQAAAAHPAPTAIDAEWAAFEQAVLKPASPAPAAEHTREVYEGATIVAEPELAPEVPEGFPPLPADGADADAAAGQAAPELTEDEKRRRREQDDRELIMDRLLEEERAQEEADAKVAVLKNRLDALRKLREAKKAGKSTSAGNGAPAASATKTKTKSKAKKAAS